MLEAALRVTLQSVADEYGLYLDHRHPRPARGGRSRVEWRDDKGNTHDLDFVLEQDGSETTVGRPRALVEIAWRRYTKHSRNKAQEIQGAIVPLAETYRECHPFLGVVLGGVFTDGSITQLRSHGFHTLYFPYESIVAAFAAVSVDAWFDEDTPDSAVQARIEAYESLGPAEKETIPSNLRDRHAREMARFLAALRRSLDRTVRVVYVVPLYGRRQRMATVQDAIDFLHGYRESQSVSKFVRYEVCVRYTNGDEVRGEFKNKDAAIAFLECVTQN